MGGYGSGRYGGRPSVERTDSLRLHAKILGRLQLGRYGTATTSYDAYDGEYPLRLTIDTRNNATPYLELSHRPRNGDEEDVSYRVWLTTTQPTYGGRRWWFRCPIEGHRCAVLYLPLGAIKFASREAYRLGYQCQKETKCDRLIRRAQKMNFALGGDGMEEPEKPKGMWQRTYDRKLAQWEEALERADEVWWQSVQPLLRHLP